MCLVYADRYEIMGAITKTLHLEGKRISRGDMIKKCEVLLGSKMDMNMFDVCIKFINRKKLQSFYNRMKVRGYLHSQKWSYIEGIMKELRDEFGGFNSYINHHNGELMRGMHLSFSKYSFEDNISVEADIDDVEMHTLEPLNLFKKRITKAFIIERFIEGFNEAKLLRRYQNENSQNILSLEMKKLKREVLK